MDDTSTPGGGTLTYEALLAARQALDRPVSQPTTPVPVAFNPRQYLELLLTQTGSRIEDVDSDTLLLVDVAADKNAVNQLIFGRVLGTTVDGEPRPETPINIEESQAAFLKNMASISNETLLYELKNKITYEQGNITRLLREIDLKAQSIAITQREYLSTKATVEIDLTDELTKILKGGWYRLHRVAAHCIEVTTPEVVITHKNTAAGVDMTVNLGSFRVVYEPKRKSIKVFIYSNNVPIEGYVHPHVARSGEICWGNAAAVYSKAVVECKPSAAFNALRTLLQTYNDASPYQSIGRYYGERNAANAVYLTQTEIDGGDLRTIDLLDNEVVYEYHPDSVVSVTTHENDDGDEYDVTRVQYYRRTINGQPISDEFYYSTLVDGFQRIRGGDEA